MAVATQCWGAPGLGGVSSNVKLVCGFCVAPQWVQLAPAWILHGSGVAPCGSRMAPTWLLHGSLVAPMWLRRGSHLAPA